MLLLQNFLKLASFNFIRLCLGNLCLRQPPLSFDRQPLAIIIYISSFWLIIILKPYELPPLVQVLLGHMEHALPLGQLVHVYLLRLVLLQLVNELVIVAIVNAAIVQVF